MRVILEVENNKEERALISFLKFTQMNGQSRKIFKSSGKKTAKGKRTNVKIDTKIFLTITQ